MWLTYQYLVKSHKLRRSLLDDVICAGLLSFIIRGLNTALSTLHSPPLISIIFFGLKINFNYRSKQLVKLFGAFEELRKATISFIIYVCLHICPSEWNNSAFTGRIFMKFDS